MNEGRLDIEERNGAVIVTISNSSHEVYSILPPEQAQDVSTALAEHAYHAQTGRSQLGKHIIAERVKTKLQNRCTLVLKNGLEKGKKPGFMAAELVDIILSEVL